MRFLIVTLWIRNNSVFRHFSRSRYILNFAFSVVIHVFRFTAEPWTHSTVWPTNKTSTGILLNDVFNIWRSDWLLLNEKKTTFASQRCLFRQLKDVFIMQHIHVYIVLIIGERASYVTSLLLAMALFLTSAFNILPDSSKEIPFFPYIFEILLLIMVLLTICLLHVQCISRHFKFNKVTFIDESLHLRKISTIFGDINKTSKSKMARITWWDGTINWAPDELQSTQHSWKWTSVGR